MAAPVRDYQRALAGLQNNKMSRAWYPFYVGDYQKKTAHLSLLEHGAYRLLIDHYMATNHPLPNDHAKLYRICRARSPSERKAVLLAISEFFIEDGTLLRNKKCDSELIKQLEYSNSQSAKAKLRHSRGNADAYAGDMPARASTTTITTTKKESIEAFALTSEPAKHEILKSKKGTRLPEDWEIPYEWGEWAEKEGLTIDEINFQEKKFKNHWLSTTKNPTKRNWRATWENWILTYLEGKNNGLQKRTK